MSQVFDYSDFFNQVPWFYEKMTRDGILELLHSMNDFHLQLKVIHIAGTNGKGSCTKMLSAIYQKAGYRTGTFTSPYVMDYRECVTIDETMISLELMNRASEEVAYHYEELKEAGKPLPTHYECITASALYAMYLAQVDLCVIEALMGGKNDATNVFEKPLATIITNISLDHTEYLGNTLESIADHKAGIMKKDKSCVLGPLKPKALSVIQTVADNIGALLIDSTLLVKDLYTETQFNNFLDASILKGKHQEENLGIVLSLLDTLKEDYPFSSDCITEGLASVKHMARIERLVAQGKTWIIDGGHNEEGINALYDYLMSNYANKNITMIFGMLADKDYNDAFRKLMPLVSQMIIVKPENMRGFDADAFYGEMSSDLILTTAQHTILELASDIPDAFARANKYHNSVCVVCGSFYVAMPVRSFLTKENDK